MQLSVYVLTICTLPRTVRNPSRTVRSDRLVPNLDANSGPGLYIQ